MPAPATAPTLVLASASPARLATLRAAGIEPVVRVAGIDEQAALAGHPGVSVAEATRLLARAKAEHIVGTLTDDDAQPSPTGGRTLVLGCDSLLELDGQALGKPADAAQATARWRAMRGRSGVLHSGHWLVSLGQDGAVARSTGAVASTTVHFADVTDVEVDAYVATGEPLAVAGAFTVDGLGGPFVTGIEGDYHTVVGLSLPLLRTMLAEVGVAVTDLWATP